MEKIAIYKPSWLWEVLRPSFSDHSLQLLPSQLPHRIHHQNRYFFSDGKKLIGHSTFFLVHVCTCIFIRTCVGRFIWSSSGLVPPSGDVVVRLASLSSMRELYKIQTTHMLYHTVLCVHTLCRLLITTC